MIEKRNSMNRTPKNGVKKVIFGAQSQKRHDLERLADGEVVAPAQRYPGVDLRTVPRGLQPMQQCGPCDSEDHRRVEPKYTAG